MCKAKKRTMFLLTPSIPIPPPMFLPGYTPMQISPSLIPNLATMPNFRAEMPVPETPAPAPAPLPQAMSFIRAFPFFVAGGTQQQFDASSIPQNAGEVAVATIVFPQSSQLLKWCIATDQGTLCGHSAEVKTGTLTGTATAVTIDNSSNPTPVFGVMIIVSKSEMQQLTGIM